MVSEPYLSTIEDASPSEVKLSEPLVPLLLAVVSHGEWWMAHPVFEHFQRQKFF